MNQTQMSERKRNRSSKSTPNTSRRQSKRINRQASDSEASAFSNSNSEEELLSEAESVPGHSSCVIKQSSQLSTSGSDIQPSTFLKMGEIKNFSVMLRNALLDTDTAGAFCKALEPLINRQTTQLTEKIEGLEKKVAKQSTEIDSLKLEIDHLQQLDRRNNVRITGIKVNQIPGSGVPISRSCKLSAQTMFRERLGIEIEERDIEDAFLLGQVSSPNQTMILKFATSAAKTNVMQLRVKKLKGCRPAIYINDDLTKRRAEIFKLARQGVKDGKAYAAWTRNGRIFMKKQEGSPITEIHKTSDMNNI